MEYKCLKKVKCNECGDCYEFPIVGSDGGLTEDEYDHGFKQIAIAKHVELSILRQTEWEAVLSEEIGTNLLISDSRIMFCCDRWSSNGKILTGHMRYEWISSIGYMKKTGRINDESMQIYYKDTDRNNWVVELQLIRNNDVKLTVQEILKRTANYRLKMTDEKNRTENTTAFLSKYAKQESVTSDETNKFIHVPLPSCYDAPEGRDFRPAYK